LWAHISPALLAGIVEEMYAHAREQMILYVNEVGI
jgi:hypothetical protein